MYTFGNEIIVAGHRGDRVHGMENTMAAIRMAVEAGADMIETDMRMTKDGEIVLMHDESVDRTTDGTGLICEMTLEEIRKLNAAVQSEGKFGPEPPATLREFLEYAREHPTLLLNMEFKDYPTEGNEAFAYACCDKIVDLFLEYGVESRTWINSFDGRILERVYRRCGDAFHYHGFYPWFILGDMTIDPESFIDVACMQHREQLADGTIVKCEEALCPREWFDYLLAKGIMPLMAPSLQEYPKYDLAFSWGSRMVNPDDPYSMLEHLRKQGLHK